eukprot:364197-Chlamydomonas_euryale.AAC.41
MHIVDVDQHHDAAKVAIDKCNNLGDVELKLSELLTASDRRLQMPVMHTSKKDSKVWADDGVQDPASQAMC